MAGRRYANTPLRDPETGRWDAAELKHRAKGWLAVLLSLATVQPTTTSAPASMTSRW